MRQYAGMTAQADRDVSYFGATNLHNGNKLFGIKQPDRLSHVYTIGKTGVGKSTLIETLAHQDLSAGRGFALIDPHGDLSVSTV
jgi:type IV secretory pathway VirB4 component